MRDEFALTLHLMQRVDLSKIEGVCNRADGVIEAWQVQELRDAVEHARSLFNKGEVAAAMEAGQAAWNLANSLFNALDVKHELLRDRARQEGTRVERRPKINNWIRQQLEHDSTAKSPELWGRAPEWIKDQIGERRFATRVTNCRRNARK